MKTAVLRSLATTLIIAAALTCFQAFQLDHGVYILTIVPVGVGLCVFFHHMENTTRGTVQSLMLALEFFFGGVAFGVMNGLPTIDNWVKATLLFSAMVAIVAFVCSWMFQEDPTHETSSS